MGLADTTLIDLQVPFSSTKPSGLGLAIAIINDHRGELTLGEVRKGTKFIVALPYKTDGLST